MRKTAERLKPLSGYKDFKETPSYRKSFLEEQRNYEGVFVVVFFTAAFFLATFFLVAAFLGAAFFAAFFFATFFFVAPAFFFATIVSSKNLKPWLSRSLWSEAADFGSRTRQPKQNVLRFKLSIWHWPLGHWACRSVT
jgi:hypothetical protein